MFDAEAYKRSLTKATDEELYDILTHPDDYLPEALELVREAIRSRNVDPASATGLVHSAQERRAAEDSVASARADQPLQWPLRLLCFVLSFGVPQLVLSEVYLRPRGYTRRAKECWLCAACGVVFYVAVGIGVAVLGARQQEAFAVAFVREATDSCLRAAGERAMPQATATSFCACSAQYLVDHHSPAVLARHSQNPESPDAKAAVAQAVAFCEHKEFTAGFLRTATESCARVAHNQGMPEATARSFCACYAQYLVDHYSASTLTDFSLRPGSPESQRAFAQATTACQQ